MKPSLNSLLSMLLVFVLAGAASAAPSPQAEREIEQLIAALGASGCDFQRNGNWYGATQAQAHLRKKHAYLRKRDLVSSAEQFIERAGSESSLSGRAYRVRCQGRPPVASAAWLRAKLAEIRRTAPSR